MSPCDCGAPLLASGRCQDTGGYPARLAACPIACPLCRGPLQWDGGCGRCYGTAAGQRPAWAFPGDRYEREGRHYLRVDGPRRACTPEENRRMWALLLAMVLKHGPDVSLGLELAGEILAAHAAPWEPGTDG